MKKKWILLGAALVILVINLLHTDFTALRQLSPADFLPVLVIILASFLLKTGALSALLIGIQKLWAWIKRK